MIPNGTRVKVNMVNDGNQRVITLLNRIGGEVVKKIGDKKTRIGYLVAYDVKHLAKIEQARELDTQNNVGTIFFHILGHMRPKDFPDDGRYYLLAFEDEVKPN